MCWEAPWANPSCPESFCDCHERPVVITLCVLCQLASTRPMWAKRKPENATWIHLVSTIRMLTEFLFGDGSNMISLYEQFIHFIHSLVVLPIHKSTLLGDFTMLWMCLSLLLLDKCHTSRLVLSISRDMINSYINSLTSYAYTPWNSDSYQFHVYKFGHLPGFSKMFLDFPACSKVYRSDSPAVAAQVWPPWLPTTAMAPAAATIPGRARCVKWKP